MVLGLKKVFTESVLFFNFAYVDIFIFLAKTFGICSECSGTGFVSNNFVFLAKTYGISAECSAVGLERRVGRTLSGFSVSLRRQLTSKILS